MKEKVVYHGSSTGGLTRLEPFVCKHGKPYVYATTDYLVVLHFAAKGQGMFDGWVDEDDNGVPIYFEARPNSFKERYYGKSSFCYHLPADTFTNATGDPCEVVSEVGVDVIKCDYIKDVGKEYEPFIKEGKFKVAPYGSTEFNTKEMCEKYIIKILKRKGYFEGKDFRQKAWASEYYKDLIDRYQNGMEK